jgi:hypothetical protein
MLSLQVLLCSHDTTAERVQLLLRRCLAGGANGDGRTFCLGAVHELTYDVQVAAVDEFERLLAMSQHECQFRLVILVANEDTHLCNAIAKLYSVPSDRFMSDNRMTFVQRSQYMQHVFGQSESDLRVLRVCARPGDGKSFFIEQKLQKRSRRQRHNLVLTELITKDCLVKQLVALDSQALDSQVWQKPEQSVSTAVRLTVYMRPLRNCRGEPEPSGPMPMSSYSARCGPP